MGNMWHEGGCYERKFSDKDEIADIKHIFELLKRFLSFLLAILIVGQSLTSIGILLYYTVNKNYIATKLCQNRNNPQLHCNGKCYLSKQLKNAEEKEQKQSTNLLKEKEECSGNNMLVDVKIVLPVLKEERLSLLVTPILGGFLTTATKPPTS